MGTSILKNKGAAPADDKGTTAAAQQSAVEGSDMLGEQVTVVSRKGNFRHPFSGALVQEGVELIHKFDSFLHGQWRAGRIKVIKDGDEVKSVASAIPLPGPVVDPAAKAAALAPDPVKVLPILPAAQTNPENGAVDPTQQNVEPKDPPPADKPTDPAPTDPAAKPASPNDKDKA